MTRRIAAVAAVVALSTAVATACTPHQVATFKTLTPDQQDKVITHLRRPTIGPFLRCVRAHESGGDYRAQNPRSTASGAFQFINSTWRKVSASAGHGGYARAMYAPPAVQDAVAIHTVRTVGRSPWAGTGC